MKKRAFVRYTKKGKVVPGSLIVTSGSYPQGSALWKEVPADLCCGTGDCPTPDFGAWRMVTGGIAGDGTVLVDDGGDPNSFTIIGPDDTEDDGWVYLKRYFPTGDTFNITYKWTSFDDSDPNNPPNVDWPVYWTSATEPTGIPADVTVRVGSTPENGTWTVTVPPGEWFAIGIYSDDSCCGRGFLQLDFNL